MHVSEFVIAVVRNQAFAWVAGLTPPLLSLRRYIPSMGQSMRHPPASFTSVPYVANGSRDTDWPAAGGAAGPRARWRGRPLFELADEGRAAGPFQMQIVR